MSGQASHELEMKVPPSKAWELYGTLELAKFCEQKLTIMDEIRVVEGDGGAGTVLQIIFAPGTQGPASYKEKFTKIDNDKRVKEVEAVEGGFLDAGFTLYRVRFEVIDKDSNDSCIVRSTIEYELKQEFASNACLVSTKPLEEIALLAATHLETQDLQRA
ncbi:hypothetical protein Ancab_009295 [Ancistrocladus abbreviatus]